ncbi:hypothetical protein GCM10011339_11510 [Echinicola rosea]|uniref:Histidine kinase domain-containing protein n=2 Tax=Echinicola rosea TaxID=1807691 RepID=A0ABQ1UTG7_9BACT|nr:hypothetical protein GCM10011339_11510 [Echinicola rosea]
MIKDSIDLVNHYNRLGVLFRTRNSDSSFHYGIKAKHLATKLHYLKGLTDADLIIAHSLYKKGLYAESLELLGNLLADYKELNDTEKIIRINLDMAEIINKEIYDKNEIIPLLRETIKLGDQLEKDSIMSEVYMTYIRLGPKLSKDSIDHYLERSAEIAKRYHDVRMQHYNRMWRTRMLILEDEMEQALPRVKAMLESSRSSGNHSMQINCLFQMMAFYEDNPRMSLHYLYQAREVAKKSGDKYVEIYILNYGIGIARELGDKDETIYLLSELKKAREEEWEKSKKFFSDYIKFNTIKEDNRLLNEKNKQKALWIIITSLLALFTILVIYLIMLGKSRKAKAQIDSLNETASLQVIAMEEMKHAAIKKEQQRMGQELHDGLSATIAAIKHNLEGLYMEMSDPVLKNRLSNLTEDLAHAYALARDKSHEWYLAGEKQESSFEQQIKALVDSALPDGSYQKSIQIDPGSMRQIDLDTRIVLFRIIQEAITNIIKHAKAKRISLLIYEEPHHLSLSIKDDGDGMPKKNTKRNKPSMGLQSIQRRVQLLNGHLSIQSSSKGTEINVDIPFP